MSAIFGMLRFDGGEVSAEDLERMSKALAHRGPDGSKNIVDGPVGLGHGLLRVNQEDAFEAQPLHDADTDVRLVADCRLDNRDQIAAAYGITTGALRRMSDSAIILAAYRRWGDDCASYLLGDFAFALWDGRARRLLLARDHMGQRYVHYYLGPGVFVFATEIKALWEVPAVPRAIDEDQLGRVLLRDSEPREDTTLFKSIAGLAGGSLLTVEPAGTVTKRRYWEPHAAAEHIGRDPAYYIENYRRVLADAVTCRISRLTTPPAICLSAGYDSAAIAGLCGPALSARNDKLIAVSSVLPEDREGAQDIRPWVEFCRRDMPHLDVRYVAREPDALAQNHDWLNWTADDIPSATGYILRSLFETAAGAGARLIMDGLGGDETLNPRGGNALAVLLYSGQLRRFLSELQAEQRVTGRARWTVLRNTVVFRISPVALRRWWLDRRELGHAAMRRFLAPEFVAHLKTRGAVSMSEIPWLPQAKKLLQNSELSLARTARRPRATYGNEAADCGLDVTRPMLDRRVVEFALAIPPGLQVVDGRRRDLACRALADVYPPEYQTRERRQDPLDPDMDETVRHALPYLQLATRQMFAEAKLKQLFSLEELAAAFDIRRGHEGSGNSAGGGTTQALRAFVAAAYVSWFARGRGERPDLRLGANPGRGRFESKRIGTTGGKRADFRN